MLVIPGILANANKGTATAYKLSLINDTTSVIIYESDSLSSMMTYLSTYTISAPTTLQFNTSDTFPITSILTFNFSNGANLFRVKAKAGAVPIIDAQNALASVMLSSMSNFEWNGVNLHNANINDVAGCIVRHNANTINITYANMKFKRGYCAMRATGSQDGSGNTTAIIENMTIRDCVVEDTINGSFRLGNGDNPVITATSDFNSRTDAYYDMKNITIENVTLVDNFNKGPVTGYATGFMGMLILKKTLNLTVRNFVCNNTSESLFQIESGKNVLIDKMICDNFGCRGLSNQQGINITNVDGMTIKNTFVKPNADTIGKTLVNLVNIRDLNMYYNSIIYVNTGDIPINTDKLARVRLIGNLFKSSGSYNPCSIVFTRQYGYTPSIAQDLLAEDYNVFCSAGTYNVGLKIVDNITTPVAVNVEVQINTTGAKITPATYRSTYNLGANSAFVITTAITTTTRINPDATTSRPFYLSDASSGRNLVSSQQGGITIDCFGFTRTYPTDAGAADKDAIV